MIKTTLTIPLKNCAFIANLFLNAQLACRIKDQTVITITNKFIVSAGLPYRGSGEHYRSRELTVVIRGIAHT